VKSRSFCSGDLWRSRFRDEFPEIGRREGTADTKAWANSREAGELLGLTSRLHPQMRGCIEALGVGDGHPRWVPDSMVIRASSDDPRPLWGELMGGPALRLRLALMGWAQDLDVASLSDDLDAWEGLLAVEHVRRRAVRKEGPRDDSYLKRGLKELRKAAADATAAHPDPRERMREELFEPREMSALAKKYQHLPEVPLDDRWYSLLGWTVRPPSVPHTSVADGLLSQGWHLVTPPLVLGWMVALPLLGSPKGRTKVLGERHLGLRTGFQSTGPNSTRTTQPPHETVPRAGAPQGRAGSLRRPPRPTCRPVSVALGPLRVTGCCSTKSRVAWLCWLGANHRPRGQAGTTARRRD
jgi:hypothetical protein